MGLFQSVVIAYLAAAGMADAAPVAAQPAHLKFGGASTCRVVA